MRLLCHMQTSPNQGGTNPLTFTFVPETGRLPCQVSLEKNTKLLPIIVVEHQGGMTQKPEEIMGNVSEKNMQEPSESVISTCHRLRSENNFPRKNISSNDPEAIKNDDFFIAEFVVVMDSDDSEDEIIIKKTQPLPFQEKRMQQSTTQFCSVPTVGLDSYKLQMTNISYPAKGTMGSKELTTVYVPPNIHEEQTTIRNQFPTHFSSQKSKSSNILTTESSGNSYLTKSSGSSNNVEIPSHGAPNISKCAKSNALSPLPIQVIKYPLCRSPSPLNCSFYGSSSTICSGNICTSPVPRPESASPVSSRLSFLTSLLKSKKSNYERGLSPDPNQYETELKPTSQTVTFQKATLTSQPPRKALSCFSLNYVKESKILPFQRKDEILSSASDSNILRGDSLFYQKPLRTFSPDSINFKSSSGTLISRKGVVSPYSQLYRRSITPPYSTRENISLLNDKPPLSRSICSPIKKDCVFGKSRKVTLFPPPLHFNPSYVRQKENMIPHLKRCKPSRDIRFPSYASSESSIHNSEKSCSSMDIQQIHGLPQPCSNILYHENMESEMDISPPLHPSYSCHSYSTEELSRKYTPIHLPTNTLELPESVLSRFCELRPTSSLAQSSDPDNKKLYKIKSRYKSFAAIPTNTLLLDQKAIDEPGINTANTATEDKMETRTEMCSPALLRQQTEEICAEIDEHCNSASTSRSMKMKCDTKSANTARPLSKSAGRETKYAFLQPLMNTKTNALQTKPGVIRPTTLKMNTSKNKDENPYLNTFQQFSMPPYKRETDFQKQTRYSM
ncbi:muscular LMNA-interacting protein isoform X2 [Pseudophryne corroboree]|uniref:muscular LMNA-interacting protein isoform X2 n=1 Tax=Pseudophryne corroboree TaxID=495146 RepID=UPI00308125F9